MPASGVSRRRSSLASSSFADADGAVWFKLVNTTLAGVANLQSVVGGDLAGYVRDWSVSHAVDDVAALTTQYQQRSWNWHSIYTVKGAVGNQLYPLLVTTLATSTSVSGTVVAGGSSFYTVTVPTNGTEWTTLHARALVIAMVHVSGVSLASPLVLMICCPLRCSISTTRCITSGFPSMGALNRSTSPTLRSSEGMGSAMTSAPVAKVGVIDPESTGARRNRPVA